jgi:hypothetical protein
LRCDLGRHTADEVVDVIVGYSQVLHVGHVGIQKRSRDR